MRETRLGADLSDARIPNTQSHACPVVQVQQMPDTLHTRPPWDDYFMDIAFQVAKRGTCDRARVGAIVVRERRILTTGYNGSPAGLPHCDDIGHLMIAGHCVRTLHAEQNAISSSSL
jgi:deoxycytidylate deaminase